MEFQSLFRSTYVEDLRRRVADGSMVDYYRSDTFEYDATKILFAPTIFRPTSLKLRLPEAGKFFDADNAKTLHESFKTLTPLQASDTRLWTYLAHVDLFKYMSARWTAVKEGTAKDEATYILSHWFIATPSQGNLLRHGLAGLWWSAHLSHDPGRENPYELTDVLYRQLDFATRTLGVYKLGRSKSAVLGILEFMVENPDLFSERFESKQRFVTKYLNQLGGVKPLPFFDKQFFKSVLESARYRIADA